MLFNIPFTIWTGILTLIFLILTAIFGVSMKKGRFFFKYHRVFAAITLIFAIIHSILAFLLWFYGIKI